MVELLVDCGNTAAIEEGAFNEPAFKTIEKLTLKSVWSGNMLTENALSGLNQLKILHFIANSMATIPRGILNTVAGTLEELIFEEASVYSTPIVIASLTGANPMLHLTVVDIQRNMNDTITNDTFVALVNIIRLDLSFCQIQVITAGAFNPIINTIEELNMSNNYLTQIPVGLFDRLVSNPNINIYLDDNKWLCDCNLCYLRWIIRHTNLSNSCNLICRHPLQYRGDFISDVDFCDDPLCDEYSLIIKTITNPPGPDMTENTSVSIMYPGTTTNLPNDNDTESYTTTGDPVSIIYPSTTTYLPNDNDTESLYRQQCNNTSNTSSANNFVMLPKNSHQFKFLRTHNQTVAVLVESRICDMFLLWFDSSREVFRTPTLSESQAHGCAYLMNTLNQTTNFQQVIVINTLLANVPYVFCLMERNRLTVSPLNCMPYMNMVASEVVPRDDDYVWLFGTDQTILIAVIVTIMFGSVLIGFLVAYLLLRRQTKQLETTNTKMAFRNHSPSFDCITESSDCKQEVNG